MNSAQACWVLLVFSTPAIAQVDLSPAIWDDSVREYFEAFDKAPRNAPKPLASGERGAISATSSAPTVYAGLQALEQGGTAADVITTALAQVAWVAGAYVSYAGYFEMLYYDARSDHVYSLDAGFNSVLAETEPASIPRERSGRTALVPGFMAGVEAAHRRFGRLPWSEVFEPAIYFAEQGFVPHPGLVGGIRAHRSVLERLPDTKAVFTKENGDWYSVGDLFTQPEVANTLRAVVAQGADYMYTGEWGQRFVDVVRSDGGRITMDDMEAYEVIWSEPLKTKYAGVEVYAQGLPALGGAHIVEALNLAKEAKLSDLGDYAREPMSFYWLSQITNLAVIPWARPERIASLSAETGLDLSLAARTSPAHASKLWDLISHGRLPLAKPPVEPSAHTDAIVAIDEWGNVAAAVHSINTEPWGRTGIFVDGVSISDAGWVERRVARAGPGNRVSMEPPTVITLMDGKPHAALAAAGVGIHETTLCALINLLDRKMSIKEAIEAPAMHHLAWDIDAEEFAAQVVEGEFSDDLLTETRRLGLNIVTVPYRQSGPMRGYVVGAMIDTESGHRSAATNVASNALPLAY